jgi:Holliday junction resolvase RusA-like endonuclease
MPDPHLQVYGFPARSKQRPFVGSRGAFTPARTLEFERKVAEGWTGPQFDGPVYMIVNLLHDSFTVEVGPCPLDKRPVRGDADNYLKAIGDGLNKIAFRDDKQVVLIVCALDTQPELLLQLSEALRER